MNPKTNGNTSFDGDKFYGIVVLRLIVAVLICFMCFFRISLSYRGLSEPVAMDQAQIARSVANGEGFCTSLLRPIEVKGAADHFKGQALDFSHFRDSNYAPLNIYAMALGLKLTGFHDFDNCRMEEGEGYIYEGDRVVSAISMIFFLIAMLLSYLLIMRLFDEVVAGCTVTLLTLSNLMLDYATSALPQMLMLCCMTGALLFVASAVKYYNKANLPKAFLMISLSFVCITLLSLSAWMGLCCAAGLLLFCAMYFRPCGSFVAAGILILGLGLLLPAMGNNDATGTILGNAYYGIYNSFGGGEEAVMRSATPFNIPLNKANFVLRLVGYAASQFGSMYNNLGSIAVTPFFLLALFNKYKKKEVEGCKWAVFSMWCFACIGMALYGVNTPLNASQTGILFAPVFTAYGLTLVFNFIARLKLSQGSFNVARGLAMFFLVVISAGPMLASLPMDIYMGFWLGGKGRPQFPPYYPTALNGKLVDMTAPDQIIATDQPWAVAWYANRKALWLPQRISDFTDELEPVFQNAGTEVQGILITPSSHSPMPQEGATAQGGINGVINNMGDFAPLAVEGKILLMLPRHNVAVADLFMENASPQNPNMPLGQLVSSRGRFSNRTPLLGTEIMYYSKAAQPQE